MLLCHAPTGVSLTILITALALLSSSVGKSVAPTEEIYIRTNPSISVEKLAAFVRPMGRLAARERGSRTFLVQLNPGLDADKVRERIQGLKGAVVLEPEQEPVDFKSIKSLDRKIAHLTADEAEEREKDHKSGKKRHDEADYLKAYRYFVGQRAFPNDTVDWSSFEKGRAHAAKMAATTIGWSGTGVHPLATPAWQFIGPTNLRVPYEVYYGISPVNGRINTVAYDPNSSQTIYIGSAQGGVWSSTDSGTTWKWLSSSWTQLAVNKVLVDPTNTATIYAARGDYHGMIAGSYGIMKSTDSGVTWTELGLNTFGQIGVASLMMDPTNPQILIAGTGDANSYGSLYRSTNGGSTWTQVGPTGNDFLWCGLTSSTVSNSNARLYAVAGGYGVKNGATSRVYKSDDHGATWQLLASPVPADGNFHWAYAIAASPTNFNNVYVLDSEGQALYTSTNQGASWTNQSANLPAGNDVQANYNFSQSFYDYHLECGNRVISNVNTDVLYLGEIDVTESVNGGVTWTSLGGPTYETYAISHNDQHALAISPTNPNQGVFTNDGGIYSFTFNPSSGKNTITPLNKNLGISMFYRISAHPTNPSYILGGTQDNASPLSVGDLSNWLNVGGGDGGGCAINQTNPLIQYTTSESLGVYRTADGWNTESDISPNLGAGDTSPFVSPLVLDPQNQKLMYTGTNYLYQWNETTQNWTIHLGNTALTAGTSGATIQTIAVAPTDSNRIYVGSTDGALFMSTTQGTSWKRLNPSAASLPGQTLTSLSVSPTNPSDILIGFSGSGQSNPHLFRCQNTAASTPVFTSVSGSGTTGLPDVSLNSVVRDLDNPATTWWVAMDAGIFQTSNSGQTWTNAGSTAGLPNVIVDDLVITPGTRYLVAGTYGMGAWRINLPTQTPTVTLTGLTVLPAAVSVGGTSVGTVTLNGAAPIGGTAVSLKSSLTTVATVPGTVIVAEGASSATFSVAASATLTLAGKSNITATLNGVSFTEPITVSIPTLTSLVLSPTSVIGGATSIGTVSISVASTSDVAVTLKSSNLNAQVPATVTIPAGLTTGSFTVTTSGVSLAASSTISAKLGALTKTAILAVKPQSVQSLLIAPTTVVGGSQNSVNATVTLTGPAPVTGAKVVLSSSLPAAAAVPLSITIPSGGTTATFTINHLKVAAISHPIIKATFGGVTQTATLTVNPFTITAFTLNPTTTVGGTSISGSVTLSDTAGAGSKAIAVRLASTSISVVAPLTVTIPIGAKSVAFTVATKVVSKNTAATVSATLGTSVQKVGVTVLAPTLVSLSVSPSTVHGSATTLVTGSVTISSPAPATGLIVALKSSSTSAVVPVSVVVPAGKTVGTFKVTHKKVTAAIDITLTATLNLSPQTTVITLTP